MGDKKKLAIEGILFVAIMLLTWRAVFAGQDMHKIIEAVKGMHTAALGLAVALSLLFVAAEGYMIWYLLGALGEKGRLRDCIGYSFVGFFFSGITPSATGGQPVQLYCMKQDGHSMSGSSVVLMTVAVIYKMALVLVGGGLLLFRHGMLQAGLGKYHALYLLGLSLNVIVVAVLLLVMFTPGFIRKILGVGERILITCRLLRPDAGRKERMEGFLREYGEGLRFLRANPGKVGLVFVITFLQRGSLFLLTAVVYCGLGLQGYELVEIVLLQAAVYVAVDMLPIPGAQGITELMYAAVFAPIFTGAYLKPSMLITRGISFYLVLLVSLGVCLWRFASGRKRIRSRSANNQSSTIVTPESPSPNSASR